MHLMIEVMSGVENVEDGEPETDLENSDEQMVDRWSGRAKTRRKG
jgi:hypothetical protein